MGQVVVVVPFKKRDLVHHFVNCCLFVARARDNVLVIAADITA